MILTTQPSPQSLFRDFFAFALCMVGFFCFWLRKKYEIGWVERWTGSCWCWGDEKKHNKNILCVKKQKESRLIEDIYRINLRANKGIKNIQEVTSRQNNVRSVYMLCIKYHICVNAKTQLSLKGDKRVTLDPNMNEYIPEPEILPVPNPMFLCYISFLQFYTHKKKKNINHDILHRIGGSQKSGKISDMDLRSYQMAASDFWLSENGDFCTVQRLYLMLTKSLVTNSKDGKQFLEGWMKALSDLTQNLQHFFFFCSTWLKFYSFN